MNRDLAVVRRILNLSARLWRDENDLFKVNTGTREHEVIRLRWDWEVKVPELETSVFVVPRAHVKTGMDRVVVLNRIARSVIESCRGEDRNLVFVREGGGNAGPGKEMRLCKASAVRFSACSVCAHAGVSSRM